MVFCWRQNLEIAVTLTLPVDTTPKLLYAADRPKQKTTATLALQQQPREEAVPKGHPYHMPLGTSVTNELPSKWTKDEKCSDQWRGKVNPPSFIISKKPSSIDNLVSAFSQTLDVLPHKTHIQELGLRIMTEDYLTTTFE